MEQFPKNVILPQVDVFDVDSGAHLFTIGVEAAARSITEKFIEAGNYNVADHATKVVARQLLALSSFQIGGHRYVPEDHR